jgi:hypothetical protein
MASSKVELARNGDLVIYKKTGMSVAEFRRDHLEPFVPVVIADATLIGANLIKRAAAMACLAGLGGWMDVLERFGGML